MVRGICFDRNVLFIVMFWDFMAEIMCFVLRWGVQFWGNMMESDYTNAIFNQYTKYSPH